MRWFSLAAIGAAFGVALSAADPQLLSLAPPKAQVIAGINIDRAKVSPFGQYVIGRIGSNQQGLQELLDATGFDPRTDLREVLIATEGHRNLQGRPLGAAFFRGTFDVERIAKAGAAKGATRETYAGATLLSSPDGSGAVAFPDATLAIAGNAAEVRAALDRQSAPGTLYPVLAELVNRLSASQDAWVVSNAIQDYLPPGLPGILQSGVLSSIQTAAAGVRFGADVAVTAELQAETAQDAATLAQLAQLLAVLGQSNSQQPLLADVLKTLQVSTSGATVTLSVTIPESQFEQLTDRRGR